MECPVVKKVKQDKSIDLGFDQNVGDNFYYTMSRMVNKTLANGTVVEVKEYYGPELNVDYSPENLCFVFRVFLPKGMEFALVFGEDYNVKGSDFVVFDHGHLFPQDMFGVEDGKQMRDYYYYPINPPPLPVTIPTTRKDMGESKEFIYFRREDTGEHF